MGKPGIVRHISLGGNINKTDGKYGEWGPGELPLSLLLEGARRGILREEYLVNFFGGVKEMSAVTVADCESLELTHSDMVDLSKELHSAPNESLVIISVGSLRQDKVLNYISTGEWRPEQEVPTGFLSVPGEGTFSKLVAPADTLMARRVILISTANEPDTANASLQAPYLVELTRNLIQAIRLLLEHPPLYVSVCSWEGGASG